MKKTVFFLLLITISLAGVSQQKNDPPIPVEVMFGNKRTNLRLSFNKPITGKWRFNNITTATADYENTPAETELVTVNSLVYQFHPNIGASGGLQYHFLKGWVPNIAFHTSYVTPTWLLIFVPYLNFLPQYNSETVAIVEYKPPLNNRLRLYTHAQALYNHNVTHNVHDRSFYYFRVGLSINKITFGAAVNFDYYGSQKMKKENFGGFFRIDI